MSKKIKVEISEETFKFLKEFQKRLDTQDNRCTAKPILFLIEEEEVVLKPEGYGSDDGYFCTDGGGNYPLSDNDWIEEIGDFIADDLYDQSVDPNSKLPFVFGAIGRLWENIKELLNNEKEDEISEAILKFKNDCPNDYIILVDNIADIREHVKLDYSIERRIKKPNMVFFTEESADNHIRSNRHHYNEPRTYVHHAWRNPEIHDLLNAVKEITDGRIE